MKVWYNKKINLISWICIFECLHERVQISFQNEWLGKTLINCNKVLKMYIATAFCVYLTNKRAHECSTQKKEMQIF